MIDPLWVIKLKTLVNKDLNLKNVLIEKGTLNDAYHPELGKIQQYNGIILQELINKMGFPVLSNAGEEGVHLSWLIIQHSISLPDFMRTCLLEMRLAAANNDYPLNLLAYTEDRLAYLEGRKQLYGTNVEWIDAELRPTPIEDPIQLNFRRKSMGLNPVEEDIGSLVMERPPKDPVKRAKEFADWLKKTGWRS